MDTRILCGASEKGKIVVNKCLDKGIKITTVKLQKLLILMQGTSLAKYNEPLFYENILSTVNGLRIDEVDKDFIASAVAFKEKLQEYHCLLDWQEAIVNDIIHDFGNKKTFELDEVHALSVLANYNDSYIIPGYHIRKVFRDDSYQIYGDVPSNGMQYQKK